MSRLAQYLTETLAPKEYRKMSFYHGTDSEIAAIGISRDGIKGQVVQGKKHFSPVAGRVYLSHEISYAMIYAIGGDMAGSTVPQHWIDEDRYGYVFVVSGEALSDIYPDEDEIGELIYNKTIPFLNRLAQNYLTPNQYEKIMDGEVEYWAVGGKKLMKKGLTSAEFIQIMNNAKNVANAGDVMPTQVWRIDKTKTKELKRDGSNFFKLAERIKMGKIR